MKKKYQTMKSAHSEFSSLSGVESITVLNDNGCIVVHKKSHDGMDILSYAYKLYNSIDYPLSRNVILTTSCGILNCVKRDHLTATYLPSKKDAKYIKFYLRIDGKEQLAHVYRVPLSLFESYLSSQKLSTP